MARLSTLLILLATTCPGLAGDDLVPPIYSRQDSLQQTLLATRHAYAFWLAEQPAARKLNELGPWSATPLLPAAEADKFVRPPKEIQLDAKLPDGQALYH